jgi:hypothetical protein
MLQQTLQISLASQAFWWGFQSFVIFGFLLFVGLWESRTHKLFEKRWSYVIFLPAIFVTILLCWLPNLLRDELNPDEGQWVAQANNFLADPVFWVQYFMPTNWSRVLTVLPLSLAGIMGDETIGYGAARVICVGMWALFCFLTYVSMRLVFDRSTGLWISVLVTIIVSSFSIHDFVAYNSELPAITLCMVAFSLFAAATKHQHRMAIYFGVGLTLAAIPFAKEQAIFIAVALEAIILFYIGTEKRVRPIVWLLLGNFAAAILLLGPYVFFGTYEQVLLCIQITFEYGKAGLYHSSETWLSVLAKVCSQFLHTELRVLLVGSTILVPALSIRWLKNGLRLDKLQRFAYLSGVVLFAVTIHAVVYPGNHFTHYSLLLVFPSVLLFGCAIHWALDRTTVNTRVVLFTLAFMVFDRHHIHEAVPELKAKNGNNIESSWVNEIRNLAEPGDRMVVWGWDNSCFVKAGLLQGSRFMYPSFAMGSYSQAQTVIDM